MSASGELRVSIQNSLAEVPVADWDALGSGNYPFRKPGQIFFFFNYHFKLIGLVQYIFAKAQAEY